MIIFVTLKQEQHDYEADLIEVLGTFHTLNQAKDAAQEDASKSDELRPDECSDLDWKAFGDNLHEAEAVDFSAEYSVTRHTVPKAVFDDAT